MPRIVLATGGGAVMNRQLFDIFMSKGTVINLRHLCQLCMIDLKI